MGMERYRAIVRLEEIRSLLEAGEYEAAKATADSIKKEKLKDSGDLFLLATVYRKCGEPDTAKEFLMRIYEKKVSCRVLEELMEVCLAEKNPEEAQEYYNQYVRISGGDPRNYIYEYRIGRQKHRPDEELLPVLQTLKAEEYTEKYAYELAKLYHKLGMEEECMAECADLILWFGEGTYVERAIALQAYYRGELSVEDIKQEAERRIQEAEERRAKEEEERKAFEDEQNRYVQEQQVRERLTEEEEARRLEDEERLALEEIYRSVAKGRFGTGQTISGMTPESVMVQETYEEASYLPEQDRYGEEMYAAASTGMEEVFEEVAVTEVNEPMWEEDDSVSVSEEEEAEAVPEEPTEEPDSYEQISLFTPEKPEAMEVQEELPVEPEAEPVMTEEPEKAEEQTVSEELQEPEETLAVSELGKELSARLSERDLVFEELLHEFAHIERVRKQLVRMLEVVVTVRKKCHCLIITGENKSGKTTLGTYLAKLLYELSYVKTPRVAKISGERLNRIDLNEKKEQLRDVCLIVENAAAMTDATAEALLTFIRNTNVLGTVILEDNANAMSGWLRNHGEFNREFNNRVHLPKFDSDELMRFALGYIEEQDYEISPEAKKILRDRIAYVTRMEQKDGRLVATMETVREALKHADYRNQGTILAMASAGNFLAAEALVLTAEDFGVIQ